MTFWALFIIAAFGSGIFSLSKFLYRSADDFDNYKKKSKFSIKQWYRNLQIL